MNIIKGISFVLGCLWLSSCSDLSFGDRFLGDQPESSGATTEFMFQSKENAEKVLTKAYTGLIYGITTKDEARMGGNVLESLTDLCQSFRNNVGDGPTTLYYNGQLSPNDVATKAAYMFGGQTDWTTIRYAWLYIENVNKVPNMSAAEKSERIAEAKVLIALSYFRMMRYVGGVIWLDHAVDINETMNFTRSTFAQTVDNIVALLNEAIAVSDFPWKHAAYDDGRMSKAAAMALKFQVLHWAASPAFNSNDKWHPQADESTCYGNYSKQRWEAAVEAGRLFFAELGQQALYSLTMPADATHTARRLAYRSAYFDRGGTEVLISIRKGYNADTHQTFVDQRFYSGPTLNYVEMFPWADGAEFPKDFNWLSPSKEPFFEYKDGKMEPTRDPRLYENVACPGETYCNGTTAPVYTNHGDYKFGSGFLIMKYVLQDVSDRTNRPVQWSYLRLPEIMLGYAEAIAEANGESNSVARKMVNDVRARVGLSELPDMDKDPFVKAVIKERALELGFEEVRWFDLVRRNLIDDFKKPLYGLQSKGDDLLHPTKFTFKKVKLDAVRYWVENWDAKWYLAPIPQNEINKKYGMTQNPGW